MKKKEKKKEKNTLLIVILLVIPALVFAYLMFSNNQTTESKPLNDAEYEVATGKVVYDMNKIGVKSDKHQFLTEANKMEESDAIFFIGHEDYGNANYSTIETANKGKVDTLTEGRCEKGIEIFYRDIGSFLETKYDKMGERDVYYASEKNPMGRIFPKQAHGGANSPSYLPDGTYDPGLNETFGTDIYDYFQEHELKIKCEDINLEKLCVCTELEMPVTTTVAGNSYTEQESYLYIGTAEVTTEHAVGDMDEFGVFGNEGETVKIKIYTRGNSWGIWDMYFEKM